MNCNRIVGVLGGSFNPVHNGHLELAKKAHEQFDIPKILMMPAYDTYYKDNTDLIAPSKRLDMLRLAIESNDLGRFISASSLDIDRGKTTYTRDTISDLKNIYDSIYFIVGSDSLMYIDQWRDASVFLKECTIITAKRKTDSDKDMANKIIFLEHTFCADIKVMNIIDHPFSSSTIREKIRLGEDVSEMIPFTVYRYILENNLYK